MAQPEGVLLPGQPDDYPAGMAFRANQGIIMAGERVTVKIVNVMSKIWLSKSVPSPKAESCEAEIKKTASRNNSCLFVSCWQLASL